MIKNWLISKFQIKILCLWVVPRPLKGYHFYRYFEILLILVWNAKSAKTAFIVYGSKHHSVTRKIGFRVISKFMIDWQASQSLISFYKTNFSLISKEPLRIFEKFQNHIWLTLESSGHRNSAANFKTVG